MVKTPGEKRVTRKAGEEGENGAQFLAEHHNAHGGHTKGGRCEGQSQRPAICGDLRVDQATVPRC